MQTTTVLLLFLAFLVAAALSFYQYLGSAEKRSRLNYILAGLRCLSFFVILLLLLNPELEKTSTEVEKQKLLLLTDQSRSMQLGDTRAVSDSLLSRLQNDEGIQDRFELEYFPFGESLILSDSMQSFSDATDLNNSLTDLLRAYRTEEGVVVVISDGKQTYGEDYGTKKYRTELPIFTLAVGDTTSYADLAIERVNTNSLAFLNNEFPVEAFISYEGKAAVRTALEIYQDGKLVSTRRLEFDPLSTTATVSENLDASATGYSRIQLKLRSLEGERNLTNNEAELAVEVLDEKTRVALVSNVLHPDLGVLRKSITANPQREVSLFNTDTMEDDASFDLFILYQPDERFRNLHERLVRQKANLMVVAGPGTDWEYLNNIQNRYTYDVLDEGPVEARAILNPAFSRFDISEFEPGSYPPLASSLGDMLITVSAENLLEQQVRGVETGEAILVALGTEEQKELLWTGSGFWKWRLENYREDGSFLRFDNFMDKMIRYLAEGADRDRLQLSYEPVFRDSRAALLSAVYLDEALEFDPSADLQLSLRDTTGQQRVVQMPLRENRYQADLSDLPSGEYSFVVQVANGNISENGTFRILDLDLEGQLLRTPFEKLQRLAEAHEGALFFPDGIESLAERLTTDPRFSPILRTRQNVVSLISFPWLLAVLFISLAAEWFIRKYNGYN